MRENISNVYEFKQHNHSQIAAISVAIPPTPLNNIARAAGSLRSRSPASAVAAESSLAVCVAETSLVTWASHWRAEVGLSV